MKLLTAVPLLFIKTEEEMLLIVFEQLFLEIVCGDLL